MTEKIGIIIGRFQTDELHEGHRYLIEEVAKKSSIVAIGLGVGQLPTSGKKPLSYEYRQNMILKEYLNVFTFPVYDHPNDSVWSSNLDQIIFDNRIKFFRATPEELLEEVVLYGSRDSFIPYYSGKYKTEYIESADLGVSATLRRERIAKKSGYTKDFAQGVIWANENMFPTVYGVVDMVIRAKDTGRFAMITKEIHGDKLLFPGGFADPTSLSYEDDATRETQEEIGLFIPNAKWKYITSLNTNDWRYSGEKDVVRTSIFWTEVDHELELTAGDDAASAQWVKLDEKYANLYRGHRPVYEAFLSHNLRIQ